MCFRAVWSAWKTSTLFTLPPCKHILKRLSPDDTEWLNSFFDGGHIATRVVCSIFLTWKFKNADRRNTGTLVGDLAETYFVLFLTEIKKRLKTTLFERDFQIFLMKNIRLKFRFMSKKAKLCFINIHIDSYLGFPLLI